MIGIENLACMRLTENGLLRWYAACCNTPIGNTSSNFKIAVIGLVHNYLTDTERSLNDAFGPIRMHVHTRYAKGDIKPKSSGLLTGIFWVTGMILRARLNGSYKASPFFDPESGTPIVIPKVLSNRELNDTKNAA
jgi:Family of unknown function (DUF6151)